MLLRLFKLLTITILLFILGILLTTRTFPFLNSSSSPHRTAQEPSSENPTEEVEEPIVTVILREATSTIPTSTPATVIPQTKGTSTTRPTSPTVTQTPTTTLATYETLRDGASDTEEGYLPTISPCTQAMGYSIGSFDERFGISKTQFKEHIAQAVDAWNDAGNKTLFYYADKGPLTINLIYDERQSTTQDINYLALDIENAKQNAEGLRVAYETEKAMFEKENINLPKDIESYKTRLDAYNKKVSDYNASGGAKKIEYDAMMSELANLKQEAKLLEERRVALVDLSASINSKVARYNQFVVYVNSLIRKSNSFGAKKFTEGRFVPSSNTIDIYQYSDAVKLRRVLIHELGHALGIGHTQNKNSIMYSINMGTSTLLSKEDIVALKEICQ